MDISSREAKVIASLAVTILESKIGNGTLQKGDTFTLPSLFGLEKFPYSAHEAGMIGKEFCQLADNRLVRQTGRNKPRTEYIVL